MPLRTYFLNLHGKQGDDFNFYLSETRTISEALRVWAKDFRHHADVCDRLATAFEGHSHGLEINADNQIIELVADTEECEAILQKFAGDGTLSLNVVEDEDDD